MLFAIVIISVLALANYLYFGEKLLLYPPVVFCAVWAAYLFLLLVSGEFFFPVSSKTLAIFVGGCICFSLGGAVAQLLPQQTSAERIAPHFNKSINVLVFVVLLGAPFVYSWISSMAGAFAGSNFFMSAYMATTQAYEEGGQPIVIGNTIFLAAIVAMLAMYERVGHGKRALSAFLLALLLLALTGGRGMLVILMFGVIAIEWMRSGRLNAKIIVPTVALLLILVSALAVLVHKGDATENQSVGENLKPITQGLVMYAAGGIPAFSQVVERPNIIPHNWQIERPVLLILNHCGFHIDAGPLRSEFLTIGPDQLMTNVYTMYFAYMDYGWALAMLFTALSGFGITRIYRRARSGRRIATLMYGYFFAAMLLSSFSDFFFMMGLNFFSKLFIVSWCVYSLPVWYARFRIFVRRSIASDLAPS